MFGNTLFYVLVFTFTLCQNASSQQKIKIEVLYESLCPDSINFITNQLYPAWDEIAPFVNIKFIPFGKSLSLNNGQYFSCQHGSRECVGNKIQSCALAGLSDPNARIEFVNCFMRKFNGNKRNSAGQACAATIGLNWSDVINCYKQSLGTLLQLQAELDTARVAPSFVPTIVYNGVFDQFAQDTSLTDFRSVVCSYIAQQFQNACQTNT